MRAVLRLLAFLSALALAAPAGAVDSLSAPEAAKLVQAGSAVLVDVRTPKEWTATGIPQGAGTASWGQPNFVADVLALVRGDRNAPLVLICRTGNRSERAATLLLESGFTQVRHVGEGMAGSGAGPGWMARGLPVVPWPAGP